MTSRSKGHVKGQHVRFRKGHHARCGPLPDRYWPKVDRGGGIKACWPWTGEKSTDGYGRISLAGGKVQAQRLAWEFTYGPIPPGLEVCHSCDNPPCCNPAHLFVDTHQGNMDDMWRKGRGRRARGEQHGLAKLTEAQVIEIRRLNSEEWLGCSRLAIRFGVSETAILNVLAGRTWAHLAEVN